MSRKICIVSPRLDYAYHDEIASTIHATDWTEVTEQEFKALKTWEGGGDFTVLEMPEPEKFIKKSVAEYLNYVQRLEREEQQRKAKQEERKRQRELKKLAKTEEQERLLLEELKQKYNK